MPRTYVNNNIKLKSGGGLVRDTDGLSLDNTYTGFTDLYKAVLNFILSASDNLVTSDDSHVSLPIGVTTKVKEILLNDASGIIRIKFNLVGDVGNSRQGIAQIYKNGVAYGTARATVNDTQYSEDLSFVTGDLIQIYGSANSGASNPGDLYNLRLYYTKGVKTLSNTVNL